MVDKVLRGLYEFESRERSHTGDTYGISYEKNDTQRLREDRETSVTRTRETNEVIRAILLRASYSERMGDFSIYLQ